MISQIEVALRVRLVEALLIHGEPLVLQDSSILKKKKLYWKNMSTVASEIARLMMCLLNIILIIMMGGACMGNC